MVYLHQLFLFFKIFHNYGIFLYICTMKAEQTKCPNLCFKGSVKHFTDDRALFTMVNCTFCKGKGTVSKDEYESINKSI